MRPPIIYVFNPDGTFTKRRATKADDDAFYAAFSRGVDKGQLTILRSPQGQKTAEPRPTPIEKHPRSRKP